MTACPSLDAIHTASFYSALQPETTRLPGGAFLSADPQLNLTGDLHSPPNRLLELSCTSTGPGKWCALHFPLDLPSLAKVSHLGLVCRMSAPDHHMLRPCLRSADPEHGFRDSFFPKHMLTTPRVHSHADALYLDTPLDLPLTAQWRDLILFLPCESFTLSIQTLHIFAL